MISEYFNEIFLIEGKGDSIEKQSEEVKTLVQKLQNKIDTKKGSDYYYFLAYSGYIFPLVFSEDDTNSFFIKALAIDGENYYAHYYYAFFLFDKKKYKKAYKELKSINLDFFRNTQDWRRLKIEELGLVCTIILELNKNKDTDIEILKWLNSYSDWIESSDDFNYPLDLIRCISNEVGQGRFYKQSSIKLVSLMKLLELDDYYKEEFSTISSILNAN